MRDYIGEFDRAHARLVECGCTMPDLAAAWVSVDRMGLEEASELNRLASMIKVYDSSSRRRPSSRIVPCVNPGNNRKKWGGNRTPYYSANVADIDDPDSSDMADQEGNDEDEAVPEEIAAELYKAYVTHETAKQKYRDSVRLRGSDAEAMKQAAADRLQAAKAKSCRRRGHWHKDACCSLNQRGAKELNNGPSATATTSSTTATPWSNDGTATKSNFPCHVVHVT